jgi:hypothetical protein
VTERTRRLAAEITAGAETPYAKAVLIEAYLRQYPFDFAVPAAPPGEDSVDYFLFELQRGYFDNFSTAMAVLLRIVDVPARIAVGYSLDEEELARDGKVTIRKNDAYSWTEVYFPNYGWVNFNASPDLPPGAGGVAPSALETVPGDIPFDERNLEDLFAEDELGELIDPNLPDNVSTIGGDDGFTTPWTLIWIVVGLVAVAGAAGGGAMFAWNWQFRGLDGIPRLWAKTQRLGDWTGLETSDRETAREWSRRLADSTEMPQESKTLSEAYQESRYGRPDLVRSDPEETDAAYISLRSALVAKILHRKPRKDEEDEAAE